MAVSMARSADRAMVYAQNPIIYIGFVGFAQNTPEKAERFAENIVDNADAEGL